MEYQHAAQHYHRLAHRLTWLGIACAVLLVSNLLLAVFVLTSARHARTLLVPMPLTQAVTVSNSAVSDAYLSQMATAFLSERFNVTPETVLANHQRLLQYVSPAAYPTLSATLNQEATHIRREKLSSTFHLAALHSGPHGTVIATGALHRYVGERALPVVTYTYQLGFHYHNGTLQLVRFERVIPTHPLKKGASHGH